MSELNHNLELVGATHLLTDERHVRAERLLRATARLFEKKPEEFSLLAVPKRTSRTDEVSKIPRLLITYTAPEGIPLTRDTAAREGDWRADPFILREGRLRQDTRVNMNMDAYTAMVEFAIHSPDIDIPDTSHGPHFTSMTALGMPKYLGGSYAFVDTDQSIKTKEFSTSTRPSEVAGLAFRPTIEVR